MTPLIGFARSAGRKPMKWRLAVSAAGLIAYDALVRPALLDWGATDAERQMRLPGDDIVVPGTVHYVEGRHSATRIHSELQKVEIGDRINTGSVGSLHIGSPVTVLEPNHALVIGTWAFTLLPFDENRTRLVVRERDAGWLRVLVPRDLGLLRALGT